MDVRSSTVNVFQAFNGQWFYLPNFAIDQIEFVGRMHTTFMLDDLPGDPFAQKPLDIVTVTATHGLKADIEDWRKTIEFGTILSITSRPRGVRGEWRLEDEMVRLYVFEMATHPITWHVTKIAPQPGVGDAEVWWNFVAVLKRSPRFEEEDLQDAGADAD